MNTEYIQCMATTWDVFVSYSSKDAYYVSHIVNDLKRAGLKVWQDTSAIAPGERIRDAIDDGIRNSAVVLGIVSLNSLDSEWVRSELDVAIAQESDKKKKKKVQENKKSKAFLLPVLIG
ncbi:MAG: toll/interleukin-1 receptor domain-containing protein, partial [Cytophagales bacterium]|nr:toll/interleukin-1 receptor domain-containing protein [Cytophagales bacterium]